MILSEMGVLLVGTVVRGPCQDGFMIMLRIVINVDKQGKKIIKTKFYMIRREVWRRFLL